jgi:hypothetical protein
MSGEVLGVAVLEFVVVPLEPLRIVRRRQLPS